MLCVTHVQDALHVRKICSVTPTYKMLCVTHVQDALHVRKICSVTASYKMLCDTHVQDALHVWKICSVTPTYNMQRDTHVQDALHVRKICRVTPTYKMLYTCGKCDTRSSKTFSQQAYKHGIVLVGVEGGFILGAKIIMCDTRSSKTFSSQAGHKHGTVLVGYNEERRIMRFTLHELYVGLARTIYIRCIYGIFGREITEYTVVYNVYVRFWPTLIICDVRSSKVSPQKAPKHGIMFGGGLGTT